MAATRILQQAAEARQHPREWLLLALRKHGSQIQLAAQLGIAQTMITPALFGSIRSWNRATIAISA